jgi:glycosyltransferase involved in cell wall biosynthesis
MACGTPIIAFGEGAVPEIVTHGATGFVVASRADMVAAVALVEQIDRRTCRADVAARFSIKRMSARYADLYQSLARNPTYRSAQPFLQSPGATGSRVSAS